MGVAQVKIDKVKALVFDLEDAALRKKCEKFVKKKLTPSEGMKEEYVDGKILELAYNIKNNDGLQEQLFNLTRSTSIIQKFKSALPTLFKLAASIVGLFLKSDSLK